MALYGLVDGLARVALSAPLGAELDKLSRLVGATSTSAARHLCVCLSASASFVLLSRGKLSLTDPTSALLMLIAVVFGALSSVASVGNKVAIERDWPKAICGADSVRLARMNSKFRAIDLACSMFLPIASGMLMMSFGVRYAALALAAWSLLACVPEALLLRRAYVRSSTLHAPRPAAAARQSVGWGTAVQLYSRQAVFLPSLGMAILYFTVLSTAGSLMPVRAGGRRGVRGANGG